MDNPNNKYQWLDTDSKDPDWLSYTISVMLEQLVKKDTMIEHLTARLKDLNVTLKGYEATCIQQEEALADYWANHQGRHIGGCAHK